METWEIAGCILAFLIFGGVMVGAAIWLEREFGQLWPHEGED